MLLYKKKDNATKNWNNKLQTIRYIELHWTEFIYMYADIHVYKLKVTRIKCIFNDVNVQHCYNVAWIRTHILTHLMLTPKCWSTTMGIYISPLTWVIGMPCVNITHCLSSANYIYITPTHTNQKFSWQRILNQLRNYTYIHLYCRTCEKWSAW